MGQGIDIYVFGVNPYRSWTLTLYLYTKTQMLQNMFYFLDKDVVVPVEMATNNIVSYTGICKSHIHIT